MLDSMDPFSCGDGTEADALFWSMAGFESEQGFTHPKPVSDRQTNNITKRERHPCSFLPWQSSMCMCVYVFGIVLSQK